MIVSEKLRAIRTKKNLTQGDIQKRTGLLRCYISRLENGHTVPSLSTIEKLARALEVPTYEIVYDGDDLPPATKWRMPKSDAGWGSSGPDALMFGKFRLLLSRLNKKDTNTLLSTASEMARKAQRKKNS